jgi:cyanate permease
MAVGGGYGAMMGILSQIFPMLTSQGIDAASAAGVIGLMGVSTLVTAIVVGFLLDRIWGPIIGFIATLIPVAGCYLLLGDHVSVQTASIAIILIGVAAGAEIDLGGYLAARYFGLHSFGLIQGVTALVTMLFMAVSGYAAGRLFDAFHEYRESLIVMAILYAVSAASYLLLGAYPKREAEPLQTPSGVTVVPAE